MNTNPWHNKRVLIIDACGTIGSEVRTVEDSLIERLECFCESGEAVFLVDETGIDASSTHPVFLALVDGLRVQPAEVTEVDAWWARVEFDVWPDAILPGDCVAGVGRFAGKRVRELGFSGSSDMRKLR